MRHFTRNFCAASLAAVMTAGLAMEAGAASGSFNIDMTDYDNTPWTTIAMANDDTVFSGVSIRESESADSKAIGYLYRGGAVNVLKKGEVWSEVESAGIIGYIKNEYLTFGTEAKGLAEYYGYYGVEANWNDVKVFAGDSADAKIIGTADDGDTYPIVNNNGHWLEVRTGTDKTAYVSSEDVTMVMVLDTAVAIGKENASGSAAAAQTVSAGGRSGDTAGQEVSQSAGAAGSGEETWVAASYSGSDPSTDDVPSGNPSYEESYTDTSYEESYTDTSYEESTYEDTAGEDASYEDTSYEDSSYDASSGDESYEEEDTGTYSDETYVDDAYSEETYTDDGSSETYEDSYEEDSYSEGAGQTTSSASSSDTDLLAAIIWCEAGNQPYEGMVAVGAVVMNRVASGSFPNTISEVIYQSGQFTPAYSGTLASALASGVPESCYSAAYDALAGTDPTGGALYFNTSHGSGVQIGAHWFY